MAANVAVDKKITQNAVYQKQPDRKMKVKFKAKKHLNSRYDLKVKQFFKNSVHTKFVFIVS